MPERERLPMPESETKEGEEKKLREANKRLRARVRQLEGLLLCTTCGHLRSEHDDNDSPCYGGREGLKPDEGYYCNCLGFRSEVSNA